MSNREHPVIVVADDDPDILELVVMRLERSGHVVHKAADGDTALGLVEQHQPDLAVLDVMMPGLDGYELTRRLREDPAMKDLLIVLLTARVQEGDVDAGLASGADDYITKPFSPQALAERIDALLQT